MNYEKEKKLNEMLRTAISTLESLPLTREAYDPALKIRAILQSCVNFTTPNPIEGDYNGILYSKCKEDFFYFYENFLTKKFQLNKGQVEIVKMANVNNLLVVKKPRQCGASYIINAYALWTALFKEDSNVCMINPKYAYREVIIKMMSEILNDSKIKKGFVTLTKNELVFQNGNRIYFDKKQNEAFQKNDRLIIYNEFCFIENFSTLSHRGYPDKKVILISSSSKDFDWKEYRELNDEFNPNNPQAFLEIDISSLEGKDIRWAVKTIENIGIDAFKQEFL